MDWNAVRRELDEHGYALVDRFLTSSQCSQMGALYSDERRFRKTISLEQHRFGAGEYKYFSYPLPPLVEALRERVYAPLAAIANDWAAELGLATDFPSQHREFIDACRRQGQSRPTPLLLHYTTGGFNCLHQDVYGSVAFPLQVACLLSAPERDFTGGEFLLVEQRPRAQSRAEAITLRRGEAIIFPNQRRPVQGKRGIYRVQMRHGVSRIRSGERLTLGIIFHDAE
jgi:hypothetical protein